MAGRTVIHDAGMIEHRRRKSTAGYVTDIAILDRWDVRGIEILALRDNTVMTGIATYGLNGRVVVVDKRVGKISRVMTQGTIGRGRRVRRSGRLFSGPERNKVAIVTGDAIAGNTLVS